MIKALEIDVEGIEQNGIIADIGNNLKLDLIYNNVDSYIYVSIFMHLYLCIYYVKSVSLNTQEGYKVWYN